MHFRVTLYFLMAINAWVAGGACRKSVPVTPADAPPDTEQDTISKPPVSYKNGTAFLALGDSYTIGQSVSLEERFPMQVKNLLAASGQEIPSPYYIAVTGWTTSSLQNAIAQQNLADSFGIVTLLIGVNDQYQGFDVTGYKARFRMLLEKSIQLAGNRKSRVFVLSIPDYSVTPFAAGSDKERIHNEIELFNRANKELTESYNVSYTDITGISREVVNDPSLLAHDGLHPSGKMYRKWAELLVPKIDAVLK